MSRPYTDADATGWCEPRLVEQRFPNVAIMYAPRSQVSHIVWERDVYSGGWERAICGRAVLYGTGAWGERVKARRMPLCKRCAQSEPNREAQAEARLAAADDAPTLPGSLGTESAPWDERFSTLVLLALAGIAIVASPGLIAWLVVR